MKSILIIIIISSLLILNVDCSILSNKINSYNNLHVRENWYSKRTEMINSLSNGMMKFFNKHDNNDLYKVVKTRVGSSNPYNSVIRKPYRMG